MRERTVETNIFILSLSLFAGTRQLLLSRVSSNFRIYVYAHVPVSGSKSFLFDAKKYTTNVILQNVTSNSYLLPRQYFHRFLSARKERKERIREGIASSRDPRSALACALRTERSRMESSTRFPSVNWNEGRRKSVFRSFLATKLISDSILLRVMNRGWEFSAGCHLDARDISRERLTRESGEIRRKRGDFELRGNPLRRKGRAGGRLLRPIFQQRATGDVSRVSEDVVDVLLEPNILIHLD